jgi:hypothetical protein
LGNVAMNVWWPLIRTGHPNIAVVFDIMIGGLPWAVGRENACRVGKLSKSSAAGGPK